jgi:hypothetical protein
MTDPTAAGDGTSILNLTPGVESTASIVLGNPEQCTMINGGVD